MLNIRHFVKGADESVWAGVLNASRQGREDWRAITVEEMVAEATRPGFDFEGRFIGELDGTAVGVVHAKVDDSNEDRKGFIRFDVIPEFRGREVEKALVETALGELKTRGMAVAQTWAYSSESERIELLKHLQFKHVRVFSVMEMDLALLSKNVGENTQVVIRPLRKEMEDDIGLFNWLSNENYKEDLDYSPIALEETRHFLLCDPYLQEKEISFAVLNGESVGCVGVGIDKKYNLEKSVQNGEVFTIGVLKKHRRKGIATRLMLHGMEGLKARGMTKAMLGVENDNITQAMRLYEKLGFSVKKREIILEREV